MNFRRDFAEDKAKDFLVTLKKSRRLAAASQEILTQLWVKYAENMPAIPILTDSKKGAPIMLHKPKILIIDSNLGTLDLFNEIINTDMEYSLFL